MYLTLSDYEEYNGTIDSRFDEYAYQAGSIINYYTFNRLTPYNFSTQPEATREAVKRCEYEIIKLLAKKDQYLNPADGSSVAGGVSAGIARESNDGVSVSYNVVSASQAVQSIDKEVSSTISMYLQGCVNNLGYNLLYRGLYPNE